MEKIRILDPESAINISDHISKSLVTITVFGLKLFTFLVAYPDRGLFYTGSWMGKVGFGVEKFGSGSNIPDPQHCLKWEI
jgi:hypothetical protein